MPSAARAAISRSSRTSSSQSTTSVIEASSALSTPGVIEVRSPENNVENNIAQLPAAFIDASALLRGLCTARRTGAPSSFVVAGRGGFRSTRTAICRVSAPTWRQAWQARAARLTSMPNVSISRCSRSRCSCRTSWTACASARQLAVRRGSHAEFRHATRQRTRRTKKVLRHMRRGMGVSPGGRPAFRCARIGRRESRLGAGAAAAVRRPAFAGAASRPRSSASRRLRRSSFRR